MNRLTFIIMLASLHLLEGRAITFSFLCVQVTELWFLSVLVSKAGHVKVWSESTVLTYKSFSLSISHLMTEFKVASCMSQDETPIFITSDDQLIIRELVGFLEWGGIVAIFSSKLQTFNKTSLQLHAQFHSQL